MTLQYKDTLFTGAELDEAVKKAREDVYQQLRNTAKLWYENSLLNDVEQHAILRIIGELEAKR
jgi:hypothetical protein